MREIHPPYSSGSPLTLVYFLAALMIVIAGLRAATDIIVPFLLATVLAMICAPMVLWLKRLKFPTIIAVFVPIIGLLLGLILVGTLVGASLASFSANLPQYQMRLESQTRFLVDFLAGWGIDVSRATLENLYDPAATMRRAGDLLTDLGNLFSRSFLILLTVVFILFEAAGIPRKMRAALDAPEATMAHWQRVVDSVHSYLLTKTWISLLTGAIVAVFLQLMGVDYPLLWGLVAFVLNFIPNIGSLIASIPAILLALVQFGVLQALIVATGYFVINTAIGAGLEPRVMGRRLGLSPLVVFVSLLFWGWVLGPVGMLLSVVLTMVLKIGLEANPNTRKFAVLLGDMRDTDAILSAKSEH